MRILNRILQSCRDCVTYSKDTIKNLLKEINNNNGIFPKKNITNKETILLFINPVQIIPLQNGE